jgi:hypothetical protein
MSGRVFLGANVLIYAASSLGFPEKYVRAEQIMAEDLDVGAAREATGGTRWNSEDIDTVPRLLCSGGDP